MATAAQAPLSLPVWVADDANVPPAFAAFAKMHSGGDWSTGASFAVRAR